MDLGLDIPLRTSVDKSSFPISYLPEPMNDGLDLQNGKRASQLDRAGLTNGVGCVERETSGDRPSRSNIWVSLEYFLRQGGIAAK
jgi:hypothetical protein